MGYRARSKGSYATASKRVRRLHSRRSLTAQEIDESLHAPKAKTERQWLAQPNRFDIPKVDTPKRR